MEIKKKSVNEKGLPFLSRMASATLTAITIALVILCLSILIQVATNKKVSVFGVRFFYIITESMHPTIEPYSEIVTIRKDPEALKEGDIITFSSRDPAIYGQANTHRILDITTDEKGSLCFITKGDHNPAPDAYYVYPQDIYGKVIFHTGPVRGWYTLMTFAATPLGLFCVILFPLFLAMMVLFRDFMRAFREAVAEEARIQAEKEQATQQAKELVEQYLKTLTDSALGQTDPESGSLAEEEAKKIGKEDGEEHAKGDE